MIVFSEDALADVVRLRRFLDEKSPRAAARAAATIFTAIDRLRDFPRLGAPKGSTGVRQLVVPFGASPYIVRYAILAETADIVILRIWHGREARS